MSSSRNSRRTFSNSPARQQRRQLAATTVKTTIPALLSSDPRARAGVRSSILSTITSTAAANTTLATPIKSRITPTDTYAAGRRLQLSHAPDTRIAVLNMASCWKPGGGFLSGSLAQEESLCMRSTLHAALRDEKYPLPDVCCVYTKDVCVFRDLDSRDLPEADRYYLDVVSAAAVCRPSKEAVGSKEYRALWREKMRCVMAAVVREGVEAVVLGAWGCGAYANPVKEVVQAWKEVLGEEKWAGVKQVVFAVLDKNMARDFLGVWGKGLEWVEDVQEN